jgi:hypothetical protein
MNFCCILNLFFLFLDHLVFPFSPSVSLFLPIKLKGLNQRGPYKLHTLINVCGWGGITVI